MTPPACPRLLPSTPSDERGGRPRRASRARAGARTLGALGLLQAALAPLVGCSESVPAATVTDAGGGADAATDATPACTKGCAASNVQHVVVIVQENHTFDSHFGRYCTAPTGSSPTCTDGPACCEAAPATDAASGTAAGVLDDAESANDPNHTKVCELDEIDDGKMDRFVTSTICGDAHNIVYSAKAVIQPLWDLAAKGAIADHYFQPVAGQSSANDMFLARAQWVFDDNVYPAGAVGIECEPLALSKAAYTDPTIGDLLTAKGVGWAWYAEGYDRMRTSPSCPDAPADCGAGNATYPCVFDPSDIPAEYYASTRDNPDVIRDLSTFAGDLANKTLPAVSFVKAIGYKTEHPGNKSKLSDGVKFMSDTVAAIEASPYASSTLVLVMYDEGGGYFDHVAPPPTSAVDHHPYGTRVPLVAVGTFARKNFVSHTVMEHSSIVKFIEWNWLGATGQLAGRDTTVANLGSILDPAATGVTVPEN